MDSLSASATNARPDLPGRESLDKTPCIFEYACMKAMLAMVPRSACRLMVVISLASMWSVLAGGASLDVDLAASRAAPGGDVQWSDTKDCLRCDVQSESAGAQISIVLRGPLPLGGKDRLVLEGRGEESTGLALHVSRVALLGVDGRTAAVYEEDLMFPPEWNRRTLLLDDFDRPPPETVRGVVLSLWEPGEIGRRYTLRLRRCEFLSPRQVADELRPSSENVRPAHEAPASMVEAKDRRWTNLGPGGGGWYRTVAISPHDGACLVGGDVGGVYRSDDQCRSWKIVNSGVPNTYINAFAFHPRDPRLVYAGSNGGVLRSNDGGVTWQIRRDGFPPLETFGLSAPISAIAVDPKHPNLVYAGVGHEREYGLLQAGTRGGRIYRSGDGGETWKPVDLPGGESARRLSVFNICFNPRDTRHLYASTPGGVFQSRDAGETWQRLGQNLEGYLTTFLTLKADRPETMLLAYCRGPDGRGGVLRSTDVGQSWQTSNAGLPETAEAWRIIAHPHDADTYYLGWHRQSGLFVTHDCGATWQPVNQSGNIASAWFFVGETVTGIDIDPRDPSRLVYCNDMDLYQTIDGGATWNQVATDLVRPATADHPAVWRGRGCEILCMNGPQALAVDPTRPQTLYFGYMDAHCWKSDDGGRTCYRLTNGIDSGYGRMGCVVLDPANPEIVYLSKGRNYDQHRIYKSVDGGRSFHMVGHSGSGLPPGAVFSMAIVPRHPLPASTIYAAVGGYGVYRSDDGGLTWRERSGGLPADRRLLKHLVLDPSDSRRLFLAAVVRSRDAGQGQLRGYIARSTDGGDEWELVKTGVEPQCILIDPLDPKTIYVGNRNFSGIDYPNAFYRSTDGGTTWTSLEQSAFLESPGSRDGDRGVRVYVTSLAADPSRPGTIYAALQEEGYDVSNGRGVLVSRDRGDTWEPFVLDGLTCYRVGTLIVDPVNPSRLYAGTGGNGLFRFGPPPQ